MAKFNISKELITTIAEQENIKYVNSISKKTNQLLSNALKKLSAQISYLTIDNVILQPVNELMTGAFVDNSSFIYFLGIKNAQLEINTGRKVPFWQTLKEKLKLTWQNRKVYKRKRKKKKKKNEELEENKKYEFDPTKYTIYNLTEDLQNALLEYLSESSLVYRFGNQLQIIGKDDFGANTRIIIYIVNYDGNNIYKYYSGKKEGFKEINIKSRFESLENKISLVGENFVKMIKIFNSLYYNVNNCMPNQIFIESILCSCPNDLFYGKTIYNCFIKIVNYLNINSLKNIKSINNPDKTIYQDDICGENSAYGFNKVLNIIAE